MVLNSSARRMGRGPPDPLKGEMRVFSGPPGCHLSSPEMARSGLRSTAGSMQDTRLKVGACTQQAGPSGTNADGAGHRPCLVASRRQSLRGLFCSCSAWRLAVALATGSPGMAKIEIPRPVHRGAPESFQLSPRTQQHLSRHCLVGRSRGQVILCLNFHIY